jgi:hypothetical protein
MARRARYLIPFAFRLNLFGPTVDQLDLDDFDAYAAVIDRLEAEARRSRR